MTDFEALRADVRYLEKEYLDLQMSFNLRWEADQRAIQRWRYAHPGCELMCPDHADLCVWLMEQLEKK